MAVSIRTSIVLAAAALALLAFRAFADPPAAADDADPVAPSLCATGAQQSPVDLGPAIPAMAAPIKHRWRNVRQSMIENTGAVLSVHLNDAGAVTLEGTDYALTRIDIRTPSEHTIDGRAFPLELQLIHEDGRGHHVIIAIPVVEGDANPTLDNVLATAPGRPGKAAVAFGVDADDLADLSEGMWRYEGSLTAPPCSETVSWAVLATSLTASRAQIAALAALHPASARATQPLNRRYVLKSPG